MVGWVKLPRSIRQGQFWPKTRRYTELEAVLDLKLSASFAVSKIRVGGVTIVVPKDSVFTSQVALAGRWRWDRKTVAKFLSSLNTLGILRIETRRGLDHGFTLLTFENSVEIEPGADIEVPIGDEVKFPIESPSSPHTQEQEESESVRKGSLYPVPDSDLPIFDVEQPVESVNAIDPDDVWSMSTGVLEAWFLYQLSPSRLQSVAAVKCAFGKLARVVEVKPAPPEPEQRRLALVR